MILAILVVAAALLHFFPQWTRRDLFFAVTVDPGFEDTPVARHILRTYRILLWGSAALAVLLFFGAGAPAAVIIQIAGSLAALGVARRQTFAHRTPHPPVVEVDLAATPERFPLGPLLPLLHLASIAALAIWAFYHWNRLPPETPIHFGLHGADRWVSRSPRGIYGFLGMQAGICLALDLFAWGILHWSRRISAGRGIAQRDRAFRNLNVQAVLWIACVMPLQAWTSLLRPDCAWIWIGVVLLVAVVYSVRLAKALRKLSAPTADGTPDSCWKLGLLYFNPSDPSLFVAKRFGFGYTINFGNRWSWAIVGAALAGVFVGVVLK